MALKADFVGTNKHQDLIIPELSGACRHRHSRPIIRSFRMAQQNWYGLKALKASIW
jgi:hypothetical protein